MTNRFVRSKIQPSTGGTPGRVPRPKKSGRKPTSSMQHRRQKIRRTQQRVRRIPGNGRPAFFRFQAVRHTSPIVNRSTREVAFLWKALTENSDLTFLMDDLSSRLSASTVWFMAPATAGVQAMKTGKPERISSGRIRTDQRNGTVRRQRIRRKRRKGAPDIQAHEPHFLPSFPSGGISAGRKKQTAG